ncbi:Predicted ATPase [Actinokineospora iranica]|uniref:Predicted ATPase n=2 Tax=Actinokineospora iranica TaxID=1271860 RepID=A0A1G6Z0G8_9PSEU|nr:Predicted ATPase [Actinokineospora iranica]
MLGPLRLQGAGGHWIEPGGLRLRMLLARLALTPGQAVPATVLIADLWKTEPPTTNALQSLVSRLRRALRPEAGEVLESHPTGYRLLISDDDVDAIRFEHLATQGRAALRDGHATKAADLLRQATELWRGDALTGLEEAPFAAPAIARLTELRTAAREDRLDAEIRAGRHADAITELRALAAEHPLRERPTALLIHALSLAGRQADALAEYERARRTLADELGVEPSAELRDLHVAVLRGEVARAPGRRLPVALTSFVGRQAELAEVSRLLATTRLVTLVGPGGAGKTRLSREVIAARDETAWLVELAGVAGAEDMAAAVLGALGVRETPLLEPPGAGAPRPVDVLDRLAEVLYPQRCVLVLDNCEHLIGAAARLADALLARCPGLRVLATSREPLAITGEVVFPVGPLELPAENATVERVTAAEAGRLFADRAESASPGFRVDADNAATVAEICRRLDGLPLALELAAARLRSMTVNQIAERIDDRFRLLTGGSRTSLPRHRTLRAVVEWSWDLLEKPERVLAARLSVFPGGATADAVTAVAADGDLPAEDVVYVLASLVEKSIAQAAEGRDGQVRYRMLETVRAYAAERLAEVGETERVRECCSRYYLGLLERAEKHLRGPEQVVWLARIAADHENMLAALHYAVAMGDADLAHRLALSAGWFWMLSGHHREALNLITQVNAVPGPAPGYARAALRAMAAFGQAAGIPDRDTIRDLRADLAATDAMTHVPMMAMLEPMLAAFAGDVDGAREGLRRGAAHPDPWARGLVLLGSAFLLENLGEPAEAEAEAERALTVFRDLGDRWGQAMAIGQVSERRSLRGDHTGAVAAYEESVRLVSELGATEELPGMLGRLAVQRGRAGDLDGAERDLRAALRAARESGSRENLALIFGWLASLLRLRGNLAEAREFLAEGQTLLAAVPRQSPHWDSLYASVRAQLALAENDPDTALTHLAAAMTGVEDIPDMPVIGAVGEQAALALFARGEPLAAAHMLGVGAALRGAPDLGNPELVELIARLDTALGPEARATAFTAGQALDRETALTELRRVLGRPAST